MAETTLFDLPSTPDEFGVVLTSPNLRKLDFSSLDYTTARRAILEYIKTYFPDTFNDFVASNGIIMIMEILAATTGKLSLRSDLNHADSFLPTARTEEAVVNHLALINQRIKRQTPAVVDVELTVSQPVLTDIEIDPGVKLRLTGADGKQIYYEVYRAPGDWTGRITIPASKRGVIAYGIEGQWVTPVTVISGGGANQTFVIEQPNILESPIEVAVITGTVRDETWEIVTEPIERYGSTDKVIEVNFVGDTAIFRFGDNVTGVAPLSGQQIEFHFRVGGGIRGRIGVGQLDESVSVSPLPPLVTSVPVRFRNIAPSSGGTDRETLEQAKRRAPRDFAVRGSIVTAGDYAQAASSFSHPAFGSVSKAVATVRTSRNANLVEIYALAAGPGGTPVTPSLGLKVALKTFFDDLNVLTDTVVVLDGKLKPIDIEMTVVIDRSSDATVVKERVETAITQFFDINNWELGKGFFQSALIEVIEEIDGVAYVDLYAPTNNLLPSDQVDGTETSVGFSEIIVEGRRQTSYYYDKLRAR